jgi:hypothetical protein
VTLSGSDIFQVLYTVEKGLGFDSASQLDDSKWFDEATLLASHNLEDVTMIKIVLKDGRPVSEEFSVKVNIPMLAYNGDGDMKEDDINKWKSRVYYDFTYASGRIAGYFGTTGVEAKIGYTPKSTDDDVTDSPKKSSDNVDYGEKLDDKPATGDNIDYTKCLLLMIYSGMGIVVMIKYKV